MTGHPHHRCAWESLAGRFPAIVWCLVALAATADDRGAGKAAPQPTPSFAYERVFEQARATHRWQNATSMHDRLRALRRTALQQPVVSNPVSDRYQVTCYGGTLDLVHFFFFASQAAASRNVHAWLYWAWRDEAGKMGGGSPGDDDDFLWEAMPDDLPSNALGALFGSELRERNVDLDDIEQHFKAFLEPLIAVPDAVAKRFSYAEIVLGLHDRIWRLSTLFTAVARTQWLTAEPLVHTRKLNAAAKEVFGNALCTPVANGREGLEAAGLALQDYRGKPVLIVRREEL